MDQRGTFKNSRAKFSRDLVRASTGVNPVRGLDAQNSNESVAPATQDDANREVVSDHVVEAMEEDDTNPNLGHHPLKVWKRHCHLAFSLLLGRFQRMSMKHLLTSKFWQETQ